ncbi:Sec-independent protein translocase subunit TatA/TatB [Mucilaginibacter sp. KACC 22063]|uniref:Sec-independent protein translocase subunit TatA/TatB n=1 Tax=Mucilaginibacter sp. KACC 22063 TaxID=3025666 RepID=UPI0023653DED|nr:twin-arginine translocase TatA/TatE family subunit [Mucilaginibacter sp. KACC 22063]WDF55935.1 twin-arginine translocase TatA/TatE family subunit [Mucilaginibacter sp. KACC 22063]
MFHPVLLFLNIGTPEMILILFVALLLFGGEKLPQLARGLGKGIRDFKDASEGVKREIQNQINTLEEKDEPVAPVVAETPEPIVANTAPLSGTNYTGIAPVIEHETSHADVSHLISNEAHVENNENHTAVSDVHAETKAEDKQQLS